MSQISSYAQTGEDWMAWEYFDRRPRGFFVEVGANDPIKLSQTYLLEDKGWEGILVEPQAACCDRLRHSRKRSRVFQAACGAPEQKGKARFRVAADDILSGLATQAADPGIVYTETIEVDVVTLDEILAECGNPKLDLVSIDVEGAELEVLKGFDLARFRPGLLLIEDHLHHLRVHRYLVQRSYRLVKRTGCNNWYVPVQAVFAVSFSERCRLFSKMYLAPAERRLRRAIKSLKPKRREHSH